MIFIINLVFLLLFLFVLFAKVPKTMFDKEKEATSYLTSINGLKNLGGLFVATFAFQAVLQLLWMVLTGQSLLRIGKVFSILIESAYTAGMVVAGFFLYKLAGNLPGIKQLDTFVKENSPENFPLGTAKDFTTSVMVVVFIFIMKFTMFLLG